MIFLFLLLDLNHWFKSINPAIENAKRTNCLYYCSVKLGFETYKYGNEVFRV